jgi:hypothetical protein
VPPPPFIATAPSFSNASVYAHPLEVAVVTASGEQDEEDEEDESVEPPPF